MTICTPNLTHLKVSLFLCLFAASFNCTAQQNNTLFFMHNLPEANFLNPAVQSDCKLFIGLPVISSVHANLSSTGFRPNQVLTRESLTSYHVRNDFSPDILARRNLLGGELHVTLLAIGLRKNDYYYTFSITDKINGATVYSRDMMAFIIKGNAAYENQWMNLSGTGAYFNYIREYAFGVSKQQSSDFTWGVKAKILFGKLNLVTSRMKNNFFTTPGTLNLLTDLNIKINASMPVTLDVNNDGNYRAYSTNNNSISAILLNRHNPGLAFDLGFIYNYSDRITFSGSALDLGFIYYGSYLTNYSLKGQYLYTGPLGDSLRQGNNLWNAFDSLNANMTEQVTHHPYVYFLNPYVYLGASYHVSKNFDINLLSYNLFYPKKIQNGFMVSAQIKPSKAFEASLSWSYMDRSLKNLGVGIGLGKSPLQAYLVTDNILGFLWPMSVRNINMRFGLNLNVGCNKKVKGSTTNIKDCGCEWIRKSVKRNERIENLKKHASDHKRDAKLE